MLTTPVPSFHQYHQALQAMRYRVTAMKITASGSKHTMVLDKIPHQKSAGYWPDQILTKIPDMLALQNNGYNLFYTPLAPHTHYLLVDDLTPQSLQSLTQDGFQPSVLLESSPHNFQAILTAAALLSPDDQSLFNHITRVLNQKYGDPKLSGASHPHRAPGFENRKPIHQQPDGQFPTVQLHYARTLFCAKTAAWAESLHRDQFQPKASIPSIRPQLFFEPAVLTAQPELIDLYRAHADDILSRQSHPIDYSRVDSMIALRFRILGYRPQEIAAVIQQCAPSIRTAEQQPHLWQDYAVRTAQFAFSDEATAQIPSLLKYRESWDELLYASASV